MCFHNIPGFLSILTNLVRSVHNKDENDFKTIPFEGVDTIWKCFQMQVQRIPNELFLGTRDFGQEGGPYVWKTWDQVDKIARNLAQGIRVLNLMPEIENEEGIWKFMGIYSKNREEWIITELASVSQAGTTVAFYDTLGPQSVEFVINQTKLTTIACAGQYLKTLILLKNQGRADSLLNLVSFDEIG